MTLEKRREYIQQFMDQIHEAAIEDPEVLTNLGIDLAPVVVHEKVGSE